MTTDQPTTPAETVEAALNRARNAAGPDEMLPLDAVQETSARLLVEHLGLTLDQARRAVVLAEAGSSLASLRVRAGFAEIGSQLAAALARFGGGR